MHSADLIAAKGLEDYFFQQVRAVIFKQRIDANPHTEFYLVRMLSHYCHSNNLYPSDETEELPLAIRYLESLNADQEEGFRLLKQLGDLSLFFSGFFQDSFNRKNVDIDYYMTMGGNAYHRLHHMIQCSKYGDTFRETFFELSEKFSRFVDVLSEISENSNISKDSDLLRLYEKWLATKSLRVLKKLNMFGIFPTAHPSTDIQQ